LNKKTNKDVLVKIELASVIFLLLFAESINAPFIPPVLINILIYVIVLILIIGRLKRFTYVALKDPSLLLLIGIAVTSVYWSVSPSNTLQEVRALLRSLLFSIYLAMQYTPKEQIRLLSWVTGLALIMSCIVCLFLPSYGLAVDEGHYAAWQGIFNHKQMFGRYLAFASTIFLVNTIAHKDKKWMRIIWLGFIFMLTILSQSKTSLIAFIMLLLSLPVHKIILQKKARGLLIIIAFFLTFLISIMLALNLEDIVVGSLGKNLEFNGRTPIWSMIINKGLERPFLGYGYNAFWTSNESTFIIMNSWARGQESFVSGEDVFHSHNGFLDLFIQIGIIGSIIFAYNLIVTISRVIQLLLITRQVEYFWMLQFTAVYIVFNMAEGQTLLSTNNILWIIYGYVSFSSALQLNRIKQKINI
jgi:exopolysaccharide production protein ExoQ